MTASPAGSLGSLVQDYVDVQCAVILEARTAIEARDEDAVHPVRVAIRRLRATLSTFGGVYRLVDRESSRTGGEMGGAPARRRSRPAGARGALRRRVAERSGG